MTLTVHEFNFISSLVRRESAIVLEAGKEYLVEARLLPLARKLGMSSISEYIQFIMHRPSAEAYGHIIDALTTNETSFFRDNEPFNILRRHIIPELVRQRLATRTLRVWSAACSSGQEAFSIAMVMNDELPAGWSCEILATDISSEILDKAKSGIFTQLEVNRGLPAPLLVRHFERVGAHWKISTALRSMVTFKKVNLAVSLPPIGPFDIIFVRNVLIYFDVDVKRFVLGNISGQLRPDGWIFLGSAETTIGIDDRFERIALGKASAYRLRTGQRAAVTCMPGKG